MEQAQALTPIEKRMDPEGFEFTPTDNQNQYVEFLRAKTTVNLKNTREVEDE